MLSHAKKRTDEAFQVTDSYAKIILNKSSEEVCIFSANEIVKPKAEGVKCYYEFC